MRDDTPYRERPAAEVAREQACMRQIFSAADSVDLIYEAFGGTGVTAEVLRERFPKVLLKAGDLDLECCKIYRERVSRPRTCLCIDAQCGLEVYAEELRGSSWGASLDYNRFTILNLRRSPPDWKYKLLNRVMRLQPRWVQVTDSAVYYLHLNWSRYGLTDASPQSYIDQVSTEMRKRWGLELVDWAHHRAAAYVLYRST